MLLLYNLFLILYRAGIAIASIWNLKARAWRGGRQRQWRRLQAGMQNAGTRKRVWMHCASLGEFEQGRPVLEALRVEHPNVFLILSFFSPSGYEVRKDYPGADLICYLPMDGPRAACRFLDIVGPELALIVKYEFWHYYLKGLQARQVPTVLVSGAFRKTQPFFKPWGGFFRKMISPFTLLTVQDGKSQQLLTSIGFGPRTVLTGDTRFDRVYQIAVEARQLPIIEEFKGSDKLVIAGSTWPEDELMLKQALSVLPSNWKLIIAPHEVHREHIENIESLFEGACVRYSQFGSSSTVRVLVIDNIGMLSSLYRYGEIACIGGGYSKSGIHNLLEPAVFGLPVLMGPEYKKFNEAVALVKKGFAFPAKDAEAYKNVLQNLIADDQGRAALQGFIKTYVKEHTGATAKILALLPQAL